MPASVAAIDYLDRRRLPSGATAAREVVHLDDPGRKINRRVEIPAGTTVEDFAAARITYWNDVLSADEREQSAELERAAAREKMRQAIASRPSQALEGALGMTREEIKRLREALADADS